MADNEFNSEFILAAAVWNKLLSTINKVKSVIIEIYDTVHAWEY